MNVRHPLHVLAVAAALGAGSAEAALVFNFTRSTGNAQADTAFDAGALR